ncbi:MAG TPA: Wadjet anti-phage system protein JetD domain-containing protein [Actinocrinis sp.]|uniref:Wadjet anti-phage system protein JetD domain-containing protein n=1 Tax=Actinocrinis sp. TaxID=1920516 RepID=UPI002DDD9AC6|nr:Wadjet anti-phage system protein JetD domain-containing protein [Actinocrinis sp.]HEV2345484.1 Wadjet anti-phage system protein JetD domain-containing protein [Actinocrinis sp.]
MARREADSWTTPADAVAKMRVRFERGEFLTAFAAGRAFEPLGIPLHGPSAAQLGADLAAARAWVQEWEQRRPPALRLEYKEIGGRVVGTNRVPARAWIDGYEELWAVLGVGARVHRFTRLRERAESRSPALAAWCAANPLKTLANADEWERLVATAGWIGERWRPGLYVRQIDVPGVDTKFVETHRGILTELLAVCLPAERIDYDAPPSDFAARHGFARRPDLVRIRALGAGAGLPDAFSEISVRVAELADAPLSASRFFVVENEINFLAFPSVLAAVAVWGGGYAVNRLAPLAWLREREVVYWGDIDTHGFAILSRMRARFPATRSMLMDRATLLAHRDHWVREPKPTRAALPGLTPAETALYEELRDDVHGPAVRLEQERIRFHHVENVLRHLR